MFGLKNIGNFFFDQSEAFGYFTYVLKLIIPLFLLSPNMERKDRKKLPNRQFLPYIYIDFDAKTEYET